MSIEMEPFKNREHVVAEIRKCALVANICSGLAILFVLIGILCDLVNENYVLQEQNWFLLAIFAGVAAVMPEMHVVMARHLLGAEVVKK